MSYTMIVCEDVPYHMIVDISKNGDKYVVGLWYREKSKNAKRSFDNLKEAYELYANMSKLFAFGLYSVNDRFEIFNGEWTNWKWEGII